MVENQTKRKTRTHTYPTNHEAKNGTLTKALVGVFFFLYKHGQQPASVNTMTNAKLQVNHQ